MLFGQLVASVIDLVLAVWAGAVAVLILSGGEGWGGGLSDAIPWVCLAAWCVAAPAVGFLLRRAGRAGAGSLVAVTPVPLLAVFFLIV